MDIRNFQGVWFVEMAMQSLEYFDKTKNEYYLDAAVDFLELAFVVAPEA